MRELRAENVRQSQDLARLAETRMEEKRKAEAAASAEADLKTQLKAAETMMRALKEEAARAAVHVTQIRATCATDLRRRDLHLDSVKKQLVEAGRLRGSRANPALTTISVEGDADLGPPPSLDGPGAENLSTETKGSLTELSLKLSEENEALMLMIHRAVSQLRAMSGYKGEGRGDAQDVKGPSLEDLAIEVDAIVRHMRNILTNPSFVPIEEVVVREEEIQRLKAGWIKMETRWKEAVQLLDGWRRRMAETGKPVCDEELKMGLRLSPVRVKNVDETGYDSALGLHPVLEEGPAAEGEGAGGDQDSLMMLPKAPNLGQGGEAGDREEEGLPRGRCLLDDVGGAKDGPMSSPESPPLPQPPRLTPLRHSLSAGNRDRQRHLRSQRQQGGAGIGPGEDPVPLAQPPVRELSLSQTSLDDVLLSSKTEPPQAEAQDGTEAVSRATQDGCEPAGQNDKLESAPRRDGVVAAAPTRARPAHSPLTLTSVAARLAAPEREADAARVRDKLKAVRRSRTGPTGTTNPAAAAAATEPTGPMCTTAAEPKAAQPDRSRGPPPGRDRRKRESKATTAASRSGAARRRSTLTPSELEALLSADAGTRREN